LRHQAADFHLFVDHRLPVRDPQQVLVLTADPLATHLWQCLCAALWSALWEDHLQCFKDELDPAVFFDGKQGDDFAACSHQNCQNSCCGGVHGYEWLGLPSSLDTRCSTVESLVNVSLLSSFISECKTSSWLAMCSTALVSLMTAFLASSFRLPDVAAVIAATEMDAPATAAMTSIMAAMASSTS